MDILTLVLSSLMGLVSPTGLVAETAVESAIRNQLEEVETLVVRLDATPSHQMLAGQIDRIRLAGRGLYPIEGVRIDTLEVETDALDLNLAALGEGEVQLDQPLQGMVRLVFTLDDINQALQSDAVTQSLRDLSLNALGPATIGGFDRSDVVRARVEVPAPGRLRLQTLLREQGSGQELDLTLEFGLQLVNGAQVTILEPSLVANGEPFPSDLLSLLTDGVAQELTLRNLESAGITARLLELEIEPDAVQLIAFIQLHSESEE